MSTTSEDITDRTGAAAAAQSRERQLQALVSSLDDIVFEVDAHGTYVNIWTADETLLFRPRTEVIGKRFDEVFGEPASRPFFEFLTRTLASDTTQTLEYSLQIAGTRRWFAARYNPIHAFACGPGTGPATVSIVVRDITAFKQAEETLRASEERFRSLVEASDAIIVLLDAEGRVHYVNERATTMPGASGWRIEDVVGKTLDEFPHPLADRYLPAIQKVIASDESLIMESPAGAKHFRISIQPIHDDQGQAVLALFSATDITLLKRTQQELEELNHFLEKRVAERTAEVQDLYDNAPAGYHSLDADGCYAQVNQTELDWLGYTREELIGRPVREICTPATQAIHQVVFPDFKERGYMRDVEIELLRKDGTVLPLLLNATAIYDEQGNYVASRSTVVDNTERKRAEQALRSSAETMQLANAELARALRMKDEFLANMSHELRTPLHGILAMTETLLDQVRGPLNDHQQKSVGLIEQSGRHLLALINDLLDLSRIEAGKLELHCVPVSVDDVCRASLLFVRELAVKKGIAVEYTNGTPGIQLVADEQRLKQMLVNLLGNAVKFTPNGGHVTLSVTADPTAGLIHFGVQDDGPGIHPSAQAGLFQPFIQLDSQLSRQHEGSGLGLALVKRLAEQHGGSVRLASTGSPGEGCCFTVTLPLAPAGGI